MFVKSHRLLLCSVEALHRVVWVAGLKTLIDRSVPPRSPCYLDRSSEALNPYCSGEANPHESCDRQLHNHSNSSLPKLLNLHLRM